MDVTMAGSLEAAEPSPPASPMGSAAGAGPLPTRALGAGRPAGHDPANDNGRIAWLWSTPIG